MNLDNALSKVRGLVNKAEHPDTPAHEAAACREAADRIMLKYAIDQATLRESQPVAEQAKPAKIRITVCDTGGPFEKMFILLVGEICIHTRTQAVFFGATEPGLKNMCHRVTAYVYGFESDLRYFEILYTTLLLHMSNGVDPRPDPALADGVNAYVLHNAGLNWLEIAEALYPLGHKFGWCGQGKNGNDYMRYAGYWKRQYSKEIALRGEKFVHLSSRRTEQQRLVWRLNFADSYVVTISDRLWEARQGRVSSTELVLASSMDAISDLVKAAHPGLREVDPREKIEFNQAAWAAGHRHANTADIGGSKIRQRASGELS